MKTSTSAVQCKQVQVKSRGKVSLIWPCVHLLPSFLLTTNDHHLPVTFGPARSQCPSHLSPAPSESSSSSTFPWLWASAPLVVTHFGMSYCFWCPSALLTTIRPGMLSIYPPVCPTIWCSFVLIHPLTDTVLPVVKRQEEFYLKLEKQRAESSS